MRHLLASGRAVRVLLRPSHDQGAVAGLDVESVELAHQQAASGRRLGRTLYELPAGLLCRTSAKPGRDGELALLALLHVLDPRREPIRRGLAWLRARQHGDGSWPQEAVTGVFFGTAMLDYRLYKSYFPIWALALASNLRSDHPV